MTRKVVVTCSLNGVLTDPSLNSIPVSPKEMANAAKEAYEAGAAMVHVHFRDQRPGKGHLPSWDPSVAAEICQAIREAAPKIMINMSTGVLGNDISGPLACLEKVKPEMAAMNAGSLNYLKVKKDGTWAWPPMLFDNPISKIEKFLATMNANKILPECECFDTGIVRSLTMLEKVGLLRAPIFASLVMGVASGMPANPEWLPLLLAELPENTHWQVIAIGREDVWPLHRRSVELGGNVRAGLEDTFYLENGKKTNSNGALIENLVKVVRSAGKEIASPQEARKMLLLA